MVEYKKQMEIGDIREAYRGLMEYLMGLRAYFSNKYPDHIVSGNLYNGYMDMTYFSFSPASLKLKKLKVAIVFIHDKFRFEVWLSAYDKHVQTKYWKLAKESNWNKYNIPPATKGYDSIIEHILVENPDFSDLDKLITQIESETLKFIKNVENFLSKNKF
jgi:hypothetical protein